MKTREQIRGGYVEAFNQCSSKNKTKSDPEIQTLLNLMLRFSLMVAILLLWTMAVRLMSPTVLLLANGIRMMTRYSILNMKLKKICYR